MIYRQSASMFLLMGEKGGTFDFRKNLSIKPVSMHRALPMCRPNIVK